jgi:YD repeat-containing protein
MSGSIARTIITVLVLLLGQLWSPAAHADLSWCKGFSAAGAAECTTVPQDITPWKYQIPGPIRGTAPADTMVAAIAEYKANIAANAGDGLCAGPTESIGVTQVFYSGWDFGKLSLRQSVPVRFVFGVWLPGGNPPVAHYECSPRTIDTHVSVTREAACDYAKGWIYSSDDPKSLYCALPSAKTFEDRTCPTANPVLPGSGGKLLSSTDYTGAGAHPLQFSRTYRSRWARAEVNAAMGGIANSVGRIGWLHSYERQIADVPFAPTALRRAIRPDGSVNTFTATPNAQGVIQWQAEPGVRDSLLPTASGWDYKVFADDSVERYDSQGRLLSITERNGWVTTLSYSNATTPVDVAPKPGLLIRVANHFGRALTFGYEQSGRLAALIDPAGGAVRYGYDGFGNLASVTWQDDTTRSYRHEDSRFPGHVTGITDEAGVRYSTYAYDAQGRVASSELAGGAERLTFSYGSPGSFSTVFDASGSARSYNFVNSAGVLRPSAVSAPCPSCGSTQKSTVYDAALQPTKQIAHDGSVTFLAYDAKGRETERATFASSYAGSTTRPALNLASKVISTQWHATFNLPTQVAEPNKTTVNTYNAKGMLTGQSWTATTDATGAAKFTALKTGSTYATTWSYSASSLATTIVQKETDAGATVAVETSRWTLAYSALGDLTKITNAAVTPNAVATVTSYSPTGQPLTGKTSDGKTFTYTYRADRQVATLRLSDGYLTTYSYNNRAQLFEARASDGGLVTIDYSSAGKPTRYVANGEIVFDSTTTSAQVAGSTPQSALFAGISAQAAGEVTLPRPVPLPEIDWGGFGTRVGDVVKVCPRAVGVGLSLLLFSSEVGTCSTVDSQEKQECKKDPCANELPTSDAARREAMRRLGLPVSSSIPVASNLEVAGYEQYVYWVASKGRFVVLSHHPADKDHKCPHWHAGYARMEPKGSTQLQDIRKFDNGAWRYDPDVLVAHRNQQT